MRSEAEMEINWNSIKIKSETLEFGGKWRIRIAINTESQSNTEQKKSNRREIKKSDLEHELQSELQETYTKHIQGIRIESEP
jgi:hypothetical protein